MAQWSDMLLSQLSEIFWIGHMSFLMRVVMGALRHGAGIKATS